MKSRRTLLQDFGARQAGLTLMEMLVAAVVSLIALSAMVLVMSSSLGAATQTIELTRLTQEMRTGMEIMTRELRRANYHNNFLSCYGNADCLDTLSISSHVKEISIDAGGDCFWFWYDRPQACNQASCTAAQMTALQTVVTSEPVAGFRRAVDGNGIGSLQMTTTSTATPNCNNNNGWVDITDTNFVNILSLVVDDTNSFTETIGAAGETQLVERIGLTITGGPVTDASVVAPLAGLFGAANSVGTRQIQEFVVVRNNVTSVP